MKIIRLTMTIILALAALFWVQPAAKADVFRTQFQTSDAYLSYCASKLHIRAVAQIVATLDP